MEYLDFTKEIFKMTTIDLSLYKEKQMKRRIDALIQKRKCNDYSDFIEALKVDAALYKEFIGYITINVSEFYRNPDQWRILENEVIPEIIKNRGKIKVWSAACSTGDEPYTLVMILKKFLTPNNIKIIATDIDNEILRLAKEGRYTSVSLEGLPKEYKEKYFNVKDDSYHIKSEVKSCVEFKQHNLLRDDYPSDIDIIVCRNVLIYFTEEAKSQIYTKFNRSLKDNGYLFIGSTEQIMLSGRYGFKSRTTFFYNKQNSV